MYTVEEIIEFIEKQTCCIGIKPDDALFEETGIYGDDWSELLEKFMVQFNVDMTLYIWHYHNRGEGGMRMFDSKPFIPTEKYIPITPAALLDVANAHYWNINYPVGAHEAEENRPKTNRLAAYMLFVLFIVLLVFIYYWAR